MELKEHFKGYFDLTQDEKEMKLSEVLDLYILEMHTNLKTIDDITVEIKKIIEMSEMNDDFEITQAFKDLLDLIISIQQLFSKHKIENKKGG